jgi:hypothetical protein
MKNGPRKGSGSLVQTDQARDAISEHPIFHDSSLGSAFLLFLGFTIRSLGS